MPLFARRVLLVVPEALDVFDVIENDYVNTFANRYQSRVSVLVHVAGPNRLEYSQPYARRGYETVYVEEAVFLHKDYPSWSSFKSETLEILSELQQIQHHCFYRLLLKTFSGLGYRVSEDEWRIWLDNETQTNAFKNWLEGIM